MNNPVHSPLVDEIHKVRRKPLRCSAGIRYGFNQRACALTNTKHPLTRTIFRIIFMHHFWRFNFTKFFQVFHVTCLRYWSSQQNQSQRTGESISSPVLRETFFSPISSKNFSICGRDMPSKFTFATELCCVRSGWRLLLFSRNS